MSGIYAGVYDVRVRAVNAAEVSSPWGYAESTTLNGKVGRPGTPVSLLASDNTVWAIDITWAFPDGAGDTAYTQLQYATTNDGANPLDLTLVPYPQANYQHGPMPAGVSRWYRARLVDRIGNTGDWTAWVMGQSSAEADAYLAVVADQFMSAEDGKALMSQLDTTPEAILQNALANFDTVNQQWAQFGDNKAGIVQAQKVAADVGKAVAALETDVTAKFAQTSAAIQQKMTAYADASGGSAIYTLKTGVAYGGVNYDAGLSVAVTINGKSVDTRVAINANQFVLMSGSGNNLYSPFAVVNGQVFISSAFIQDGSIDNAKIGNFIQSRNYVSGSTGWAINKDGGAEFNNAVFRGDIYAENGWFHGTVKAARIEGDIGDTLALVEYRWGRMVGQAGFLANGTSLDFHLANVRQDPDIYRRIAFVGMVSLQIPQNTYCRASLVRSGVEVWAADVNASPLFGSSDTNMKLLTLSGLFGDIPQGTGTYEFVLRLTNNSTANWTNASVHVQLTGFTLRAGSIFF